MRNRRKKVPPQRRQLLIRGLVYGALAFLIFAAAAYGQTARQPLHLRDVGFIAGPPVTVSGYGLVVGLNGTGDGSYLHYSDRSLVATLGHLGIDSQDQTIRTTKVAAVLVQAELLPGLAIGSKTPVRVTALGDAFDLAGGTLLPLQLTSRDGRFRALAAGPVSSVGNCPLGAAPAAAIVDHAITITAPIFMTDVPERDFVIDVRDLNRERAALVTERINRTFGEIARTQPGRDIEVRLPSSYADFDERASLVLQLAALPIDEAIPGLSADRPMVMTTRVE